MRSGGSGSRSCLDQVVDHVVRREVIVRPAAARTLNATDVRVRAIEPGRDGSRATRSDMEAMDAVIVERHLSDAKGVLLRAALGTESLSRSGRVIGSRASADRCSATEVRQIESGRPIAETVGARPRTEGGEQPGIGGTTYRPAVTEQ